MLLEEINPFIRHSAVVFDIFSGNAPRKAYDHRIFYVKKGGSSVVLKGEKHSLSKGELLYIPSGTPYYFEGKAPRVIIVFDMERKNSHLKKAIWASSEKAFKPEAVLEKELPEELSEGIILQNAVGLEDTINQILLEYRLSTRESQAKASGLLKQLLCDIIINRNNRKPNPVAVEVMLYIEEHCTGNITNTQIAKALGYNQVYLNRVFKKEVGITIHQFVLDKRVALAKSAVADSSLSLDAISESCGFANYPQFCKTFKKETGKTPSEYRNQL